MQNDIYVWGAIPSNTPRVFHFGNDRSHAVLTWNIRDVFVGILPGYFSWKVLHLMFVFAESIFLFIKKSEQSIFPQK